MRDIIIHLLEGNLLKRSLTFKLRLEIFKGCCERDIELCSLSGRVRNDYVRSNLDYLQVITSPLVFVFVCEYLVKYRLPRLDRVMEVYGEEFVRYLLTEVLRINTSSTLRHKGADVRGVIAAAKVGEHLSSLHPGRVMVTSVEFVTGLVRSLGFDGEEILMVWEQQGICFQYYGLMIILVDVLKELSKPPLIQVEYMVRWGRNERLKGVKLV